MALSYWCISKSVEDLKFWTIPHPGLKKMVGLQPLTRLRTHGVSRVSNGRIIQKKIYRGPVDIQQLTNTKLLGYLPWAHGP